MKDLEHTGSITFAEESVERNGREAFLKPIKVRWVGFLASSFQEISAASVWIPMLSNPLLLSQDFVPEKYKGLFTGEGDLKSQYKAFNEYFDAFIQGISFFKYFRSQIDHKTRDAEKTLKKKNTVATFEWLEDRMGFVIKYGMGRSKKGLLEITQEYITFLKSSGTQGTKLAKAMQKLSQEEETALWGAWEDVTPPMWLSLLYRSFFEDYFNKEKKRVEMPPALTRETIDKGLKRMFQTAKPVILEKEDKVEFYYKESQKSLGFIPVNMPDIQNVHPDTIPVIRAGGEIFNSFMSHRLLRYESKIFYEQWKNPKLREYSTLKIKGGYEELAKRLGYQKTGKVLEQLRKLMFFQAGFWFTIATAEGGSKRGNLIAMEEEVNKYGKVGTLHIVAGSMLAPSAVYRASSEEKGKLLVPSIDLPEEMVGYRGSWGAQAFLQLLVLEHLTLQSREFAKKGAVSITEEDWERLAIEAKIPERFRGGIEEIQKFFCCPEEGFLDKQGDEYVLNKKHAKAQEHLLEQGKTREKRAKDAKGSKRLNKRKSKR